MWITYGSHSTAGPVRSKNEDAIGVWHPSGAELRRARGTLIVLADGVGGQASGDVASKTVVDICLREFATADIGTSPNQVLWRMFNAANLAVFDAGLHQPSNARMASTLTAAIFRHNEITIGHVGDCRAYLIRGTEIQRLTNDHSYAGVQLKLGLITVEEHAANPNRSILTRTVGQEAIVRVDYHQLFLQPGDLYLQCCDGVHAYLTDGEIFNIARSHEPQAAAEELVDAAIRRSSDDNLSVQIVRVERISERAVNFNGQKTVAEVQPEKQKMGVDLQVGDVLDGRFQTTDLIARSGMAQIFKAVDKETNLTVALKVPLMQYESDPGFYSRFEREEQIGKTLHHPYIIRILPIDTPKSRPYIVMEYLEGQTLANVMRAVHPMPEHDAITIAARICDALHYLHAHEVVHRDLKPDNIMICNDGSIRLMDFGIAKFDGMRRLTFGGFTPAMGTPDYMAPEQVKGKRGDKRTDIYSLGAILYEMLTGSTPFEGPSPFIIMNSRLTGDPVAPREKNPNISPQVEEIVLHAMARDPADRYADARDMQDELNKPQSVKITGRAQRLQKPQPWKARWSRHWLYILAAAIPAFLFLILWLVSHLRWK
jgi:serine/threonine protein phosphatase PrpC